MKVIGLDHIVLRTPDVERALTFYTTTLGLEPVKADEWRSGEAGFPSVRVNATTIIDLVAGTPAEGPGNLHHFCLVVEPLDWASEIAQGLTIDDGPDARSGAQGDGQSVYLRDPDGNIVELRHYGPDA